MREKLSRSHLLVKTQSSNESHLLRSQGAMSFVFAGKLELIQEFCFGFGIFVCFVQSEDRAIRAAVVWVAGNFV